VAQGDLRVSTLRALKSFESNFDYPNSYVDSALHRRKRIPVQHRLGRRHTGSTVANVGGEDSPGISKAANARLASLQQGARQDRAEATELGLPGLGS
jgi:hypothetical protein